MVCPEVVDVRALWLLHVTLTQARILIWTLGTPPWHGHSSYLAPPISPQLLPSWLLSWRLLSGNQESSVCTATSSLLPGLMEATSHALPMFLTQRTPALQAAMANCPPAQLTLCGYLKEASRSSCSVVLWQAGI